MTKSEMQDEIEYYLTKLMLKDMVLNNTLTSKEYQLIMAKIKEKYEPYYDLLSD